MLPLPFAAFLRNRTALAAAMIALFGSGPVWTQIQDVTPPVLTAFALSSNTIHTSTASATVTASYSVTDDVSGVSWGRFCFASPSQGQQICATFSLRVPAVTASGTTDLVFPQYSESGVWKISVVYLFDATNNERILTLADMEANSWPAQISSAGVQDTTPPNFQTVSYAPQSINTSAGPASVTISYSADDDLSGLDWGRICFASPSQKQQVCATFSHAASTRSASGDTQADFPQFSEPGVWKVSIAYLFDAAGNQRNLTLVDFEANHWPTQVTVAGSPDTDPPVFTSLSLSPSSIDTSTAPAAVNVEYSASDDVSGVNWGRVCFDSPSQVQRNCATFSLSAPYRTVTGSMDAAFPKFAEIGTWEAGAGHLVDAAGNQRTLSQADFAASGWPLRINVGVPDKRPPETTVHLFPSANANGWNNSDVWTTLQSLDNSGGSGVMGITSVLTGAVNDARFSYGPMIDVPLSAEGITTLGYYATDWAGNDEKTNAVVIRIDKSLPLISGLPTTKCTLWPPNGKLVQVATISASDLVSGVQSGSLQVNAFSNEPVGKDPDVLISPAPNQTFTLALRAERLNNGHTDRVYTLRASAQDLAGNTALATATCVVPPDQGK